MLMPVFDDKAAALQWADNRFERLQDVAGPWLYPPSLAKSVDRRPLIIEPIEHVRIDGAQYDWEFGLQGKSPLKVSRHSVRPCWSVRSVDQLNQRFGDLTSLPFSGAHRACITPLPHLPWKAGGTETEA